MIDDEPPAAVTKDSLPAPELSEPIELETAEPPEAVEPVVLRLYAPAGADPAWHRPEKKTAGLPFRWSARRRLYWRVKPPRAAEALRVEIAVCMQVAPAFLRRCRLRVGRRHVAFKVVKRDKLRIVSADVPPSETVFTITLLTGAPAPLGRAAQRTVGAQRMVGIAVLMQSDGEAAAAAAEPTMPALIGRAAPRFVVVGNCQARSYELLLQAMVPGVCVHTVDLARPASRTPKAREQLLPALHNADFVLAMPASRFPIDFLRAEARCDVFRIHNFFFRGLFPDACHIGNQLHRLKSPTTYRSVVVIDAFRRGLTEHECSNMFTMDNFERLGLLDAWASTVIEMDERAVDVDLPANELVIEACQTYLAFLTINHPTLALIYTYLCEVMKQLSIARETIAVERMPDPLCEGDQLIVHDEYADYLRLPYRTSQLYKLTRMRGFMTRQQFISGCYRAYETLPPDKLVVHSPTDMVAQFRANRELRHLVAGPGTRRAALQQHPAHDGDTEAAVVVDP